MTHLRRKFTSAAVLAALLMSPAALVQAEDGSMGSLTTTTASSTADVKQADRKEPVNTGAGIGAVAGPLAAVVGALTAGAGAVIGTRKRK